MSEGVYSNQHQHNENRNKKAAGEMAVFCMEALSSAQLCG